VIQDRAGFHLQAGDARLPANVRVVPLPPYSPELNPVEKLGDWVKDAICNRLFKDLRTQFSQESCHAVSQPEIPIIV